jgi:dolichol-phosphate mannosyltransferase
MIFVILPAYNEGRGIGKLVKDIHGTLAPSKAGAHMLLVDDGSADRTGDLAAEAAGNARLEVIRHERNRGLGRALHTGFSAALSRGKNEDIAITMDADNTHPPGYIIDLVNKMGEGYDLVIAGRFLEGAAEEGVPFLRYFLSRFANAWYRVILSYPGVRDFTCGYRAYRLDLLRRAFGRYGEKFIEEDGFTCMFEILAKVRRLNPRVCQIPFRLRYDLKKDRSKMPVIRSILRSIIRSMKVVLRS